jgi:hypothetical protein
MPIAAAGGLAYIACMAWDDIPFRFLNHNEFAALSDKDKVTYLLRASQELEKRRRQIRDQMQTAVARQRV